MNQKQVDGIDITSQNVKMITFGWGKKKTWSNSFAAAACDFLTAEAEASVAAAVMLQLDNLLL